MSETKTLILNHRQIDQKIIRIATEVYENNHEEEEIHLVGIANRGYLLAERITVALAAQSPQTIHLHKLHVEDDFPFEGRWDTPPKEGEFNGKVVILVDDVLNSGTTLIYSARFLLQYPLRQLITAVLVNRRHRLYPVRADYVGLTLATTLQEHISVVFAEGNDAVYLK